MHSAVSVIKKVCVEFIRDLASVVQAVRWETEATKMKLSDREAKSSEFYLNVQLLVEKDGCAGDLQEHLKAKGSVF